MAFTRNNHVFKGHKTLLGAKFVTYGELELPARHDLYSQSRNGFDWGHSGPAAKQLAFSILCQLSDKDFAEENVSKFTNEVIIMLNSRDWSLTASEVLSWIKDNTQEKIEEKEPQNTLVLQSQNHIKKSRVKPKTNVVKEICKELNITQKNLASILEIPEGTVSSWAVKNEIPRLGKKAIEFYIEKEKNQQIVDSYKSFVKLLNVS
ncbi:MAG: XRE family transcriptional regulator [Sulfurimonas sp.]|nr:XRE family transcriptional regulator [Sulfurimonas sp.]MCK4974246.1 XRE family transcriptional regulator [Sulfurimonas sp.]